MNSMRRQKQLTQTGLHALLLFLSVLTLFPLGMMILLAAKDPAQLYVRFWALPDPIRWGNFAFGISSTYQYILNSTWVSVWVCLLTVAVGGLAAFAFSQIQFPGRRLLFLSIISLMMIPGILMLVPLFLATRQLGLLNSYSGLILPQIAGGLPMAIFLFRAFFDQLPRDLFDSARIDGASEWQVLFHIVASLSKPIISTVTVLVLLSSWNNYTWPLVVVRDLSLRTIPLGVAFIREEYNLLREPSMMMAAFLIASIPMVVCFFFAMKTFMRGMTSGAIKA